MRHFPSIALVALAVAACDGPKTPQNVQTAAPVANETAAADNAESGRGGFGGPQTLDRMMGRQLAFFDRVDADGDGRLTPEELDAARPQRPDGDNAEAPARAGRRGFGGFLRRADADGDGIVTRAEVEAQAKARFERLDANGDGEVTREEMQAAFADRGRDRPEG